MLLTQRDLQAEIDGAFATLAEIDSILSDGHPIAHQTAIGPDSWDDLIAVCDEIDAILADDTAAHDRTIALLASLGA